MKNLTKSLVAIALCLAMIFALAACGSSASGTAAATAAPDAAAATSNAASAASAAPAADSNYPTAENPIVFKAASFATEEDNLSQILVLAGQKVEELSGGAIKFEFYFNGNLLGFSDMYTGVSQGIADIGLVGMSVLDSNTYINQVFSTLHKNLPADDRVINDCYWEAIHSIPEISQELADANLVRVGLECFGGADTVIISPENITTVADLKGKVIQCSQSLPGKVFTALGGTAVSMEVADYYTSLERGVTDGIYDVYQSFYALKLQELGKTYLKLGEGGISAGIINTMMNLDSFNKLSPEQQQMIYDAFYYGVNKALDQSDAEAQKAIDYAKDKGAQFVTLSDDDLQTLYAAMDTVMDEWFTTVSAQGYDAHGVYDKIEAIFAEHLS